MPVTLLTGFLGAGKTTLLNRILNGDHGLRVGVLVNDFGAVNIDAELIEGVEENTVALTNGCVCCEVRDDLVTSLEELLAGPREIEYVILEASGVADPEGIVMTFLEPRYERLLRLDSITCVVDAHGLFEHRDDEGLTQLKLRQIGFADLVVLNKVDLVGPENVRVIEGWIEANLNRVRVLPATMAEVPYEVLLSVGRFDPTSLELDALDISSHHHGESGAGFDTWHHRAAEPLSEAALRDAVHALPGGVLRAKGFVLTADAPDRKMMLQTVGRRTTLTDLGPWGARTPATEIVVIGRAGTLDPSALEAAFTSCRA